ncbi:hypothetical protein KIS4809_2301 [Bacillus sp. ZZV12-4809]|nr:hypothetical protein KIS4809_2301 [Bacillus sp. ZZV12-4809]
MEEVLLLNLLQLLYKLKTQKAFYHIHGNDLKVKNYQVLKVGIMGHGIISFIT